MPISGQGGVAASSGGVQVSQSPVHERGESGAVPVCCGKARAEYWFTDESTSTFLQTPQQVLGSDWKNEVTGNELSSSGGSSPEEEREGERGEELRIERSQLRLSWQLTRVHPGDTLGEVYWAYPVWRRPRADSRAAGENTFPAGLGRPWLSLWNSWRRWLGWEVCTA